jgi:hypothetical protein
MTGRLLRTRTIVTIRGRSSGAHHASQCMGDTGSVRAAPSAEAEWWTTSDVAAYLGVQVTTVTNYRKRGQMPAPDVTVGRTPMWRPARIVEWHAHRPRPGVGGRPPGASTPSIPGQACSALRCGPDAGTHGACPTASGWILTDAAVDGLSRCQGRRTRGRSVWGARRVGVGIRSGISVGVRPGGQVLSVASDVRSVLVGVAGIPPVVLVMHGPRRTRGPRAALVVRFVGRILVNQSSRGGWRRDPGACSGRRGGRE